MSVLRWTPLERHSVGDVVWAWGYDPIDRMPFAHELDAVAPGVPIFLRRVDGHTCSLSAGALKMLPQKLRRESGVYTGALGERVVEFFLRSVPKDALISAARRVALEAANAGVKTVHALVPFADWAEVLLNIAGDLPVRVVVFVESTDVEEVSSLGLKQIGGCLLLDGSLGSRTAALSFPYADAPESRGALYMSDDELERFFAAALSSGLAVAMHAIGDRAVEQYIRVAERVSGGGDLARWRIEHAELITPSQLERAARLGLVLSVQPAFELRWGGPDGMYARRLGERWRQTNPFATALKAGVALIGGSDAYVTPIDPVAGIFAAMHHPNPAHRLSLREALALFSAAPAAWAGEEEPMSPGSRAEGVVIEGDFDGEEPPRVVGTLESIIL